MSKVKVYKMRMIMGKTPNYNESGKLKNTVVIPKFVGEKELSDLLTDDAYQGLGCCEIKCIDCYDSKDVKVKFTDRMNEVNKSIKAVKQKAKTKVQLLEEENIKLKSESVSVMKRLEALENAEAHKNNEEVIRQKKLDKLRIEAEKGQPGDLTKLDSFPDRIKLEAKAKELEITFSSKIGNVKLLERINEKDKEFKL